jgi:hypothetical protein
MYFGNSSTCINQYLHFSDMFKRVWVHDLEREEADFPPVWNFEQLREKIQLRFRHFTESKRERLLRMFLRTDEKRAEYAAAGGGEMEASSFFLFRTYKNEFHS